MEKRLATFKSAVVDGDVHARVIAALPTQVPPTGLKLVAEAALVEHALRDGPRALDPTQALRLVASRTALAELRAAVGAHRAHPDWWLAGAVVSPTAPAPVVVVAEAATRPQHIEPVVVASS